MEKILTIAIPTYNRAALLDRALNSIFSQYDERIDVVVSDNASTDETSEVVKKYNNLRFFSNKENLGYDKNFIKCYEYANGKYVLLLGSDDVVLDGAISHILYFLESNSELTHVFLNHSFFKNDDLKNKSKTYLKQNVDFVTDSKEKWVKTIGMQMSFMSSLIISKNSFFSVADPLKYVDYNFVHTCVSFESSQKNSFFGVIYYNCICDDLTETNANENKKPTWIFKTFGKNMYHVFCEISLEYGFNNRTMNKLYSKYICKVFSKKILNFKVLKIDWKEDFYVDAYPYLKHYFRYWVTIWPSIITPRFIALFVVKFIKPLYRKLKWR